MSKNKGNQKRWAEKVNFLNGPSGRDGKAEINRNTVVQARNKTIWKHEAWYVEEVDGHADSDRNCERHLNMSTFW